MILSSKTRQFSTDFLSSNKVPAFCIVL
jgi:hypothetical protein